MVNPAPLSQIDIAASAARVASARELARSQAEIVARAERTADDLTIDLMYLTQESVLVFEETHQLLVALAAREDRAGAASTPAARTARRSRTRRRMMPLTLVLQFALLAIVSAILVEIIDPAPTDVQASDAMRAASLARSASSTVPATTKGARPSARMPTSR